MKVPDLFVGKRLFVGEGQPQILGRGPTEVLGSGYIEGPMIVGNPSQFSQPNPNELGTAMLGETTNSEMRPVPFYSLFVKTYARIRDFLKVDTLLTVELIKSKVIYTDVLLARSKNFIINHPSIEGKKLVHACLEGPENAVFVRGRISNKAIIDLPYYWKDLVDESTITVQLQPIGAHQNIIVKRIADNQIQLQGQGLPIDCYYHVFAERKDIRKLQTEVD